MPSQTRLDTTNPSHITYDHPPLSIAILGGIRLEGLDRMRVTLKVQVEHLALRHNLDLYNDNQTEKLVRKMAERLEIGTSLAAAALSDLTDKLEKYRLEEIEASQREHERRKMLNPKEIRQAEEYLSAPNLMERTGQDIGRTGVIGEEINRLLMYIIFTSRKREQPLHVISLGGSGLGKTHLQEKVAALIPDEDKVENTSLTAAAFYYFGKQQLKNKLVLIEDLDGAENALFPIRELQTKRKIIRTVPFKNTKGETRSIQLIVEGPVSIAGCTTKENLYEDNANRSFLIHIDESTAQDEKIMEYQRRLSAGKVDLAAQQQLVERFRNMQRILLPVQVRNPYAEQLKIPKEVLRPRRTNAHYLAFIEAVTFYHQYQRERQYDRQTGEEYIEATIEDIRAANTLMKEVLLRKADTLTVTVRNYFEHLKEYLKDQKDKSFTNRQIRQALRIKAATLKRYHSELLANGLLQVKSGKKATGYVYQVTSFMDYEQLQERIHGVLDEITSRLERKERRPGGQIAAQKENEPPKEKKTS